MSKRTVAYDHRAVTIDGRRTFLISGAIHYPRSTPDMWPGLMRRSREAGLNAIETLVFWNVHEPRRGEFNFGGRYDLRRFCEAAAAEGLDVILRIGPYICAEFNYGGFPFWLREIPGMEMRTWNKPFMREMERWCRKLMDVVRPLLASEGGPVVLVQFENEYNNIAARYGEPGQKYLQWCVELGRSLEIQEPLIMCAGGVPGAIETINSFYLFDQLEEHWRKHPEQPAISTEFYPGWYETWGYPRHRRDVRDMAYSLLRFFAAGGSGVNYYMWYGGTNFGRESMYLQTANYDFDCPLDEGGQPTSKYAHLARVHHLLHDWADQLLDGEPARARTLRLVSKPAQRPSGEKVLNAIGGGMPGEFLEADSVRPRQVAFVYGRGRRRIVFLCNDEKSRSVEVEFEGRRHRLAPLSVQAIVAGKVVLDSATLHPGDRKVRRWRPVPGLTPFESLPEPFPSAWPRNLRSAVRSARPVEQLQFTRDESDYCWYEARLPRLIKAGKGRLVLEAAADLVHVFVDGKFAATSKVPLAENRNLFPGSGSLDESPIWDPVRQATFRQEFDIRVPRGAQRIQILCCALGLVKGDWMLGLQNVVHERKGLWGPVTWNGCELKDWRIQPFLLGERCGWANEPEAHDGWEPSPAASGLRWWKTSFPRPTTTEPLFLDLQGMTKGLIYLNGKCLSRYWLLPATGIDPFNQYRDPVTSQPSRQPTQRFYHVPVGFLQDHNSLVLLEELDGDTSTVRLVRSAACSPSCEPSPEGETDSAGGGTRRASGASQ